MIPIKQLLFCTIYYKLFMIDYVSFYAYSVDG